MPPGGGGASCLCPVPCSLLTSQPQEHGHAGLAKPRTPEMIKCLATHLRDGGIHTMFHCRGRVQWLAAEPKTSSPGPFLTGSRHPPFSVRKQKEKQRSPNAFDQAVLSCSCDQDIRQNGPGPGRQKYQGGFSLVLLCQATCFETASAGPSFISIISSITHTRPARVSSNPKLIHPRIPTLPQRLYTSMELSSRSWHASLFD